MTKQELRTAYKQRRAALSLSQKDKLEDLMLIKFQQLDIVIPDMILTYAAFEKFNEFDPQLITDYCYFKNNNQVLFYNAINPADDSMYCVGVDDDTVFGKNKFGIDEPLNGLAMLPEQVDMIIVPLLAFDELGNRVGYGKGYYDRFLKQCRKDAVKIGFSFFEAEPQIADINEFDVRLDYCITPETIYEF